MATLTDASIIARKGVRYGIYLVILVIIGRFLFLTGVSIYQRFNPPPPPKPTVAYGKLPSLPFPIKETTVNLTYKLETVEGNLPSLPDQTEIYPMIEPQSNLNSLEIAKSKAIQLGFNPNGRVIVESIPNVYLFMKDKSPATLTMNIITGIFSVSYDLAANPGVINQIPPAPESAIALANSFLRNASLRTSDLSGPETTELLKLESGQFTPASSLSEAQITKVNLFRKGYGKENAFPSVTTSMPEANVWFMYTGGRNIEVIGGEYHYFPLDETKSATYPIKTAQEAWDELNAGQGFVANLGTNQNSTNIVIRKVYLAYFDPGQYTKYYQPVVVFEGDGGFIAYIPAIEDDFYGASTE